MKTFHARLGRGLASLLLAVGLSALAAGVAFAHASLVRSDPAPNTRFEQSPRSVTVWFDEPVEPGYAHLSVYDANSQRVDRLDSRYSPGPQPNITATLPDLPTGSYVVVWRVISLDDGHAVGGAFAFGVRASPDPKAAVAAGVQADAQPDLTSQLIRFVDLIGQMVLFGALVFRAVIWRPVLSSAARAGLLGSRRGLEAEEQRWLQVLSDILVGVLITGLLGALYVQARSTGVVFYQLFATRWGVVWLVRCAVVLLACLWMESLLAGQRPVWARGLSLALLLTTALTSHSAATGGALGAVADLLHEASAAVWLGGVLMLALTLLALRHGPAEPSVQAHLGAEAVARFGGLAAVGVAVLLTTGLLLGWQQVQSWSGLLLTGYGHTLLVKLALAVAALGLGAYNSLSARASAARRSGRGPAWIVAEAVLTSAVIFAAAVMTDLPPAAAAGSAGSAVATEGQAPLALSTNAQGWRFDARVTPGRIGSNVFEVTVMAPGGQALAGAAAELQLTGPGGSTPQRIALAQTRPGLFSATANVLNQQGAWQMAISLQPGAGAPVSAAYSLDIGLDGVVRAAGTPLPWTVRAVAWLNENGRAALAVLLVLGAGIWTWIASRTQRGVKQLVPGNL